MESWWYYIYQNIRDVSVKTAFTNEITSPAEATTYQDEIGLMYVSDYMYAVDPTGWTTVGYNNSVNDYRGIKGDNWVYMGDNEWTISQCSDSTNNAFFVYYFGDVNINTVYNNFGVRPVFYLNSNVEFEGGTGTSSDPYVIV